MFYELVKVFLQEQKDYPYKQPLSLSELGVLAEFGSWLDDGAAEHNVHLTALRRGMRWRFAIWLVSIGCRLAGIGGS